MPVFKQIRVKRGYTKLPHPAFLSFLTNVYRSLLNNAHFLKPFLDLTLFKTKIDEYAAAIAATMTRSSLAYAQRDALREDLMKMLLQLIGYVEHKCDNDPAILATSGLEALPSAHTPPQPLEKPGIRKVGHGAVSGELLVWLPPSLRKIVRYDIRYAPIDAEGLPTTEWKVKVAASSTHPVSIQNLRPGTLYAFQLRTFGKIGESDWSDPVTKICT